MSHLQARSTVLLKATLELLKKCDDGPFVKNVLEETVFYDNAECDGACLMEDIEDHMLEAREQKPPFAKDAQQQAKKEQE